MINNAQHIETIAIITCILAIGMFSLIGCQTNKPSDYMDLGNWSFREKKYDEAIRYYNRILG